MGTYQMRLFCELFRPICREKLAGIIVCMWGMVKGPCGDVVFGCFTKAGWLSTLTVSVELSNLDGFGCFLFVKKALISTTGMA